MPKRTHIQLAIDAAVTHYPSPRHNKLKEFACEVRIIGDGNEITWFEEGNTPEEAIARAIAFGMDRFRVRSEVK